MNNKINGFIVACLECGNVVKLEQLADGKISQDKDSISIRGYHNDELELRCGCKCAIVGLLTVD